MLAPSEQKVLDALDGQMTTKAWSEKVGYKPDTLNPIVKKLVDLECIVCVGKEGRQNVYQSTGKKPNENKTLGFTVFGVRI
jgi:hypothetical protein